MSPPESPGRPTWIRSTEDLRRMLAGLGPGPLAVDTEADSLHRYPERVCLVQCSHGGRDWLIDPLEEVDLGEFAKILGDPTRTKIFHGADYDLRLLHRDHGLTVRGLFDTMIAARLVGERAFGLSALLETGFGVLLDKKHQRADWSRRPLTREQEDYAAMDTRWLEPLADRLRARLVELGRESWAEEEFARIERVRWTERNDPDPCLKVKGSRKLDARGLALLREVHGWREAVARERQRPPYRVLRNEEMLALVGAARDGVGAALASRSVRRVRGTARERLARALERGLTTDGTELLARARKRGRRPEPPDPRMRALMTARDARAEKLDLEASVLASRQALGDALQRLDAGGPLHGADSALRRWQAAELRDAFSAARLSRDRNVP